MSALMWICHRFRPKKSLFLAATGLLLCVRPARAADPLTIQCDAPSTMINRILVIKKDVPHKLTVAKEAKPKWSIDKNGVPTKPVVEFVPGVAPDYSVQLKGLALTALYMKVGKPALALAFAEQASATHPHDAQVCRSQCSCL